MLKENQLEKIFSSNRESSVFPILATIYYNKKLYKYALKVCRIGLATDSRNLEGLYILAKTLLMQGKTEEAEKVLKNIIQFHPYHLRSTLLLICVLQDLNKNKKIIMSIVSKIYRFYPCHPQLQTYYKQYCKPKKKIEKQTNNKDNKLCESKIFNYNPKLATMTMYKLLYSQKKYEDAFSLLGILEKNPKYKKFANDELKKIKHNLKRN